MTFWQFVGAHPWLLTEFMILLLPTWILTLIIVEGMFTNALRVWAATKGVLVKEKP